MSTEWPNFFLQFVNGNLSKWTFEKNEHDELIARLILTGEILMTFLIHLGTQEGYVLHYYLTFILEVLISALNCKKNTNKY